MPVVRALRCVCEVAHANALEVWHACGACAALRVIG